MTDQMLSYPIPHNERERLDVLAHLNLLDTPPEHEFDVIVRLARRLFGCKMALVSLVDRDRQWFKAKCGISDDETPREVAFCAHVVAADAALIVPDARRDARFRDNPLVTGDPFIRFYAGVPIRATVDARTVPLGTLCVVDDRPWHFGAEDIAMLTDLAGLVEVLIAARSRMAA
jgi:GAF domain-containing protein